MIKDIRATLFPLLLFACATASSATFDETVNEELDKSKELEGIGKGQFVAVPIPVSNPTVGSGLQGALLYLHPEKSHSRDAPNATSGLGVMYTNTDTWIAGIFHDNYLLDDRLRIRLAVGTGEFNLDYYGTANYRVLEDHPVSYSVKGSMGLVQTLGRLPQTDNWFGGIKATYFKSKVEFDLSSLIPGIPFLQADITLSSLALVFIHDDRNDNYFPARGIFLEASVARDDEAWGSDFNYNRYRLDYRHYVPVDSKNVFALRVFASEVTGRAPFFVLPNLDLRGFAANRYQDDTAASVHTEWRQKFHPRWGFILALEAGRVADNMDELRSEKTIFSKGAGVRWQVSENKKLNLGIDVGVSGDEQALYVQIGEKF